MSALLKQKAKVGVATKPRKLHDIADVFKKRPGPDGTVIKTPVVIKDKDEVKQEKDARKIIKPKMIERYDEEMKK